MWNTNWQQECVEGALQSYWRPALGDRKQSVPVTSENLQHHWSLQPKHSPIIRTSRSTCTSVISRGMFSSFSDNKWKWMHIFFEAGGTLVTDGGTGVWRAVIGAGFFLHSSHWLPPQIHLSHYIQNLSPPYRMGEKKEEWRGVSFTVWNPTCCLTGWKFICLFLPFGKAKWKETNFCMYVH